MAPPSQQKLWVRLAFATLSTVWLACGGESFESDPSGTGGANNGGETAPGGLGGETSPGGFGGLGGAPFGGLGGAPFGGLGGAPFGGLGGAPFGGVGGGPLGGVGGGPLGGVGGGTGEDRTPPTVVSFNPAQGEKGVRADAVVRIRFSEPMQQGPSEQAVSGIAAPTFSWNTDSTELTVRPRDGFSYAAGGPAVAATPYTVLVGTGALDIAGNPLSAEVSAMFTTLRQVTTKINVPTGALGGYQTSGTAHGSNDLEYCGKLSTSLIRILVHVNHGIPKGAEVLTAKYALPQVYLSDASAFSSMGALRLAHVRYTLGDYKGGFSAEPLGTVILSSVAPTANTVLAVDVAPFLNVDVTDGLVSTDFRVQFEQDGLTSATGNVIFDRAKGGGGTLDLVYLTP